MEERLYAVNVSDEVNFPVYSFTVVSETKTRYYLSKTSYVSKDKMYTSENGSIKFFFYKTWEEADNDRKERLKFNLEQCKERVERYKKLLGEYGYYED